MIPLSTRTKASFCYLSALTVIGMVIFPLYVRWKEPEDSFASRHAQNALKLHSLGFFVLVGGYLFSGLPSHWFDPVASHAMVALWGILVLCALGIWALALVNFALQAWNGQSSD